MNLPSRIALLLDSALAFLVRKLGAISSYADGKRDALAVEMDFETSDDYQQAPRIPDIVFCDGGYGELRLNIVIGSIYRDQAYGGPTTLLQTAREVSRHYKNIRFLTRHSIVKGSGEAFRLEEYVHDAGNKSIEVLSLHDERQLPCHKGEIFFCGYYKTVLVWEAYIREIRKRGLNENAFYYLIQDYEPGFSPYGSEYAQAFETYSHGGLTHAIFYSSDLRDYFRVAVGSFKEEYVLQPSLNTEIHTYLVHREFRLKAKRPDRIRVLIYGRPNQPRNCFEAIIHGLYLAIADMPASELSSFEFVSAGTKHRDIRLRKGVVIRSLGKLSIDNYIAELEDAHIGISLMESPHPSYPPLEMACFGLYTITNKFLNKDLSKYHRLIDSVDHPVAGLISEAFHRAILHAKEYTGKEIQAILPENMSSLSWPENLARVSLKPIVSANT